MSTPTCAPPSRWPRSPPDTRRRPRARLRRGRGGRDARRVTRDAAEPREALRQQSRFPGVPRPRRDPGPFRASRCLSGAVSTCRTFLRGPGARRTNPCGGIPGIAWRPSPRRVPRSGRRRRVSGSAQREGSRALATVAATHRRPSRSRIEAPPGAQAGRAWDAGTALPPRPPRSAAAGTPGWSGRQVKAHNHRLGIMSTTPAGNPRATHTILRTAASSPAAAAGPWSARPSARRRSPRPWRGHRSPRRR